MLDILYLYNFPNTFRLQKEEKIYISNKNTPANYYKTELLRIFSPIHLVTMLLLRLVCFEVLLYLSVGNLKYHFSSVTELYFCCLNRYVRAAIRQCSCLSG